jgi:hypothetical protein
VTAIDIESHQNRLLKVCYVPATSASSKASFYFFMWPLTVKMKQTRQAVRAVKQTILLRCLWRLPNVGVAGNFEAFGNTTLGRQKREFATPETG